MPPARALIAGEPLEGHWFDSRVFEEFGRDRVSWPGQELCVILLDGGSSRP